MTPDHLRRLHAAAGRSRACPAVLTFVDDALRFYMEFHSRYDGFYGAFIHDALAVASALDPTLIKTESLPVEVELGGTLDDRRDRHRLAPLVGQAAEPGRRRRGATSTVLRALHRARRKARRATLANVAI